MGSEAKEGSGTQFQEFQKHVDNYGPWKIKPLTSNAVECTGADHCPVKPAALMEKNLQVSAADMAADSWKSKAILTQTELQQAAARTRSS